MSAALLSSNQCAPTVAQLKIKLTVLFALHSQAGPVDVSQALDAKRAQVEEQAISESDSHTAGAEDSRYYILLRAWKARTLKLNVDEKKLWRAMLRGRDRKRMTDFVIAEMLFIIKHCTDYARLEDELKWW